MKVQIAAAACGCVLALVLTPARAAIDDAKGAALLKSGGCVTCHSVEKKLVGPAFKDVAAKHKGDPDAVAKLAKIVRAGGKGVYGPVPMPPNPVGKISDADLHDVLEWVLTK
jgi:cytochrome c